MASTRNSTSYEFHSGQEVLLYAEVENFKSAATEQGFHTALRSSYQILDNRGARVDQKEFEITEEHCQNPRRDYFIRYFVWMPKRIYGGTYTLQLTIEDTLEPEDRPGFDRIHGRRQRVSDAVLGPRTSPLDAAPRRKQALRRTFAGNPNPPSRRAARVTQLKQMPRPQAIGVSSETSQATPCSAHCSATACIIGSGPQQTTCGFGDSVNIGSTRSVTNP